MSEDPDPGGGRPALAVLDEQTLPVDLAWLGRTAGRALRLLGVPSAAALTVTLVDAPRMAELKETAFGVREPTDVLAFPIDSLSAPAPGPLVLGDVVICPEVAAAQARLAGRSEQDELAELLVHGLLHILGRDHTQPGDERAMVAEQRRILQDVSMEPSP